MVWALWRYNYGALWVKHYDDIIMVALWVKHYDDIIMGLYGLSIMTI